MVPPKKISIFLVPKSSQYIFRKSQPISGYANRRLRRKLRIPKGLVESTPPPKALGLILLLFAPGRFSLQIRIERRGEIEVDLIRNS